MNIVEAVATWRAADQPGASPSPPGIWTMSKHALVSNNTNTGTINAFNSITGQVRGHIKDTNGKAIHIDQLWGIEFGEEPQNNGFDNQLFLPPVLPILIWQERSPNRVPVATCGNLPSLRRGYLLRLNRPPATLSLEQALVHDVVLLHRRSQSG